MSVLESINKQRARGVFAYWPEDQEAAWKALSPESPSVPILGGRYYYTRFLPNSRTPEICEPGEHSFDHMIECGRSYMVGSDVPMEDYLRNHRSALTAWQKDAYAWALANPFYKLLLETPGREWEVYAEGGDHVMFALPHHDAGGERHYVSKNGRSKILVNVD